MPKSLPIIRQVLAVSETLVPASKMSRPAAHETRLKCRRCGSSGTQTPLFDRLAFLAFTLPGKNIESQSVDCIYSAIMFVDRDIVDRLIYYGSGVFVHYSGKPTPRQQRPAMFGLSRLGVRIVSREPLNRRAILIIMSFGGWSGRVSLSAAADFAVAPEWLKNFSPPCTGGITAIVLKSDFPTRKTVIHWRR